MFCGLLIAEYLHLKCFVKQAMLLYFAWMAQYLLTGYLAIDLVKKQLHMRLTVAAQMDVLPVVVMGVIIVGPFPNCLQ
jgi:hypothetical protein